MRRGRRRRNYGLDDFGPGSKFMCQWVVFLHGRRTYVSTIGEEGPDEGAHIDILVKNNSTFDFTSEAPGQTLPTAEIKKVSVCSESVYMLRTRHRPTLPTGLNNFASVGVRTTSAPRARSCISFSYKPPCKELFSAPGSIRERKRRTIDIF